MRSPVPHAPSGRTTTSPSGRTTASRSGRTIAATAGPGIPSYNLFGELADLPDVMHCETIAARFTLHGWELAPHRHARLHQVLLVHSGGGTAQVDEQRFALQAGTLVNVPMGRVHAFVFEPGTQGWVVTLAGETLDVALAHAADVRGTLARAAAVQADATMAGAGPGGLPAASGAWPVVLAVVQMINAEFVARHFARACVLRSLAATLLGLVARAIEAAEAGQEADTGPTQLLQRLEHLIEEHHLQHWGVADYARALAVSPTHLSRLARQATGAPVSQLIQDRLLREARRHLLYTNLQVATIAYTLGFADPAHFSRVFQRATGESPRAFRRALAQRATQGA